MNHKEILIVDCQLVGSGFVTDVPLSKDSCLLILNALLAGQVVASLLEAAASRHGNLDPVRCGA
jgi:hypothetical protein